MALSWSAEGLLKPLWGRVGGRDALATLTGIPGPNLSGYNTGRLRLGEDTARKIADALHVTLADLGRPDEEDSITAKLDQILERLPIDLERQIADQLHQQAALLESLSALALRLGEHVDRLDQAEQRARRSRKRPA